ncbi:free methionine-R-sulfoxide reductase [bacterium BMS3Bbin04]|nr:free methionine-R-sulfoxide reductase [bacterium BMS3Bbin04]
MTGEIIESVSSLKGHFFPKVSLQFFVVKTHLNNSDHSLHGLKSMARGDQYPSGNCLLSILPERPEQVLTRTRYSVQYNHKYNEDVPVNDLKIIDTLIKRSSTLKGAPKKPLSSIPIDLKQLVNELVESVTSVSLVEWELLIAERLRHEIDHYSWVGFYWVKGEYLHLGAWSGPEATEHTRIPVGDGICGLAARQKETVIVDDVNEQSDYLACFPNTSSEIVVPIMLEGEAIGEIDIDGDHKGAFTVVDQRELERLAAAFSARLQAS